MNVLLVEKMTPQQRQRVKELAENDTIYMAREILGYTTSEILVRDEKTKKYKASVETGPQYGISYESPHKRMAALLDNDSLFKHLEAPRGSYKTTLLIAWCIRLMCRNPNIRIFYAMATKEEAKKTCDTIRGILETNELLIALWGEFKGDPWKQDGFTIAQRTDKSLRDPTFQIGAVDMERTGVHCDVLIGDDLITAKTTETPNGLEKSERYWKALQHFPVGSAMIVANGTRYADGDLWGKFLVPPLSDIFETVVLGCGMEPYQDESGFVHLKGEPIWPHMTKDYLTMKLMAGDTDIHEFSKQYCNMCLASGIAMFRREQIQCCRWQAWMGQLAGYILTDWAVTEKDEGCFTVILVMALDNTRRAYLLDAWIGKVQVNKGVDQLLSMYAGWQEHIPIHGVTFEETTLNRSVRSCLDDRLRQKQARMPIVPVPRTVSDPSKRARITSLAGRFQQGRIWFVADRINRTYDDRGTRPLFDPIGYRPAPGQPALPDGELILQLVRYPAYPFLDIPDAMADIDAMDRDGRYLLAGAGRSRQATVDSDRPQAGTFYRPAILQGRETLVETERHGGTGFWSDVVRQAGF